MKAARSSSYPNGQLSWGAYELLGKLQSAFVVDAGQTDVILEYVQAITITRLPFPKVLRAVKQDSRWYHRELLRSKTEFDFREWGKWWDIQTTAPSFKNVRGVPSAALHLASIKHAAAQTLGPVNWDHTYQDVIQSAFVYWADQGYIRLIAKTPSKDEEELKSLRAFFDEQYGEQNRSQG